MENQKISVVLNTFNAAEFLEQVLEAVKDFDEIVVCDMYSEDNTIEIAKKCQAKITYHERCQICEPARNHAIQSASNEWVLILDADEIVPPALKEYLYAEIKRENPPAAIKIPRKNFFMGRFMRCLYPDYVLRFARKESIDWPGTIHAQPHIEGNIQSIDPSEERLALIHLAKNTISDWLLKTNIYTDSEVNRRGFGPYSYFALIFKPSARFFQTYILKKGYREGKEGFIYAVLNAIYKFITLIKQEEKSNENSL